MTIIPPFKLNLRAPALAARVFYDLANQKNRIIKA